MFRVPETSQRNKGSSKQGKIQKAYLKIMDERPGNFSYLSNRHFNDFCLSDILLSLKNPKGSGRNDKPNARTPGLRILAKSWYWKKAPAKNRHTDKGT